MKIFLNSVEAKSLAAYLTAREAYEQVKKNTDPRIVAIADEDHISGKDIGFLNRDFLLKSRATI